MAEMKIQWLGDVRVTRLQDLPSGVVYRIAKWDEVFERAESRKLKSLSWVSIPTSFSSHGYQSMLDEFGDDAASIYGAWCALVAIGASCTVRGILCNSRGKPLPVTHLVRLSGLPQSVFEKLIEWAAREDIGWLIPAQPSELPQNMQPPTIPRQSPDTSGEFPDTSGESPDTSGESPGYITGQDITEHNTTGQDNPPTPQGGESPSVGRRQLDLQSVDQDQLRLMCRRLEYDYSLPVDADTIRQYAAIAISAGCKSVLVEAARSCKSASVRSPKRYWIGAVKSAVQEAGFDLPESLNGT